MSMLNDADLYENAIPLNQDAQTLIEAIRDLLEDQNCEIDYERKLILLHTIAEIEATALNGGSLPDTWCY
jgi:hypothetical protein